MSDYETALGGGGPPRGGARSATARADDRRERERRERAPRQRDTGYEDNATLVNDMERNLFDLIVDLDTKEAARGNPAYEAITAALADEAAATVNPYGGHGQYEEGNYAGFRTRGDLEDAVMGRMYQMQDEIQGAASQLDREAFIAGARAEMEQRTQQREMDAEGRGDMSEMFDPRSQSKGRSAAAMRAGVESGRLAHTNELGEWVEGERERLGEVREGAQQLQSLPPWQLAQFAAQEFGIDPTLARGWFDEALDAKVFGRQRDSRSIQESGLPYREVVAAEEDAAQEARRQDAALEQQAEVMFDEDMLGRFGVSGTDLAAASGLRPEQVLTIVNDPAFEQVLADTDAALENAGDDGEEIAQVQADLRLGYDPVLVKLLEEIYDYRLDPDAYG